MLEVAECDGAPVVAVPVQVSAKFTAPVAADPDGCPWPVKEPRSPRSRPTVLVADVSCSRVVPSHDPGVGEGPALPAAEEDQLAGGRVEGEGRPERAAGLVAGASCPQVVPFQVPGVVVVGAGLLPAAEQDQLPGGRVVGHGGGVAGGGAGGRGELGPGGAVPGPGVVEEGAAEPPKRTMSSLAGS